MFGLVHQSRLLEAERRIIKLRLLLHKANDARRKAETDLTVERSLREAAGAEIDRLLKAIEAISAAESPAKPEPATEAPSTEVPRVLTGLEVVSRAMQHRNVHNQAGKR